MPGAYVDERTVIANVLDGLTGVVVVWPNTDTEDDELPVPGSDPGAPRRWVAVRMGPAIDEQLTMGGSRWVVGSIETVVWVERNGGDNLLRSTVDSLNALFAAGDDTGEQFYFTRRTLASPGVSEDGQWLGQAITQHFTRFT